MFNRTLELNMVKKNKKEEEISHQPIIDVEALFDVTCKNVVKVIAAYFVLDTARKVVVNRLSK